ncbi:trypsin-like peptidase domain-containing protein [Micromonospora sp. CPCC 205371]|nr:trypsin-like peptidase domain-containing protein [Micromonospora sp. CPCC 205371]
MKTTRTGSGGVTVVPALVRLLDAGGTGHGLGLLVADREIVTCAHVVNLALGLSWEDTARPAVSVQVEFPFVGPGRRYTAEVTAWRSPAPDGSGDVAGLRLHAAPPDGVAPCSLADTADLYGHRFSSFGITATHPTGLWVDGEIRGPDVVGNLQLHGAAGPRLSPGFSGAPVWDETLQAVVGIIGRVAIGRASPGGYCLPTRLLVEAWPHIEQRTRPPCPYRGLLPMREADEANFFGRELVSRRLAASVPRGRLSLLIGASGCGKSSVVLAGALPRLRRRGDLHIAVCRPGVAPAQALASALEAGTLPTGADLPGVVELLLERSGFERLLLVVDQFEEALGHPAAVRDEFVGLLGRLAAASRPDGRPLCSLLLVARGDYADELGRIGALAEALALGRDDPGEGIRHLLPMSTSELRQAVLGPVERSRVVRYEEGLVDRLMRDVRGLENPLAPLVFALTRLWELQHRGVITLAAYESVGEVAGALRAHLDRVYEEELDAADREAARLLLLRLTAPDGRGGHVRWPVPSDDLDERSQAVARRLAGRRVLTMLPGPDGTELVELAHEALLTEWPRLRGWLDAEAAFLSWYGGLRASIEAWRAGGRHRGRLLVGAELTAALAAERMWRERLMPYELDFIARSRAGRRRTRLMRGLAAALAVLAVAAVAAVVLVRDQADTERAARRSEDLAESASQTDIFGGLSTALAAYGTSPTPAARLALAGWYERASMVDKIMGAELPVSSLKPVTEVSPDGRYAVVRTGAGDDPLLWNLDEDAPSAEPPLKGSDYAFSPDGAFLIYVDSGRFAFWHLRDRVVARHVPILAPGADPVDGIVVSRDGARLGYARGDGAYIADAYTGKLLGGSVEPVDPAPPGCVTTAGGSSWLTMTATGRPAVHLAGACDDYTFLVDITGGELVVLHDRQATHGETVRDSDPVLEIRDRGDGTLRGRFPVPEGRLVGVAPSPAGTRVVLETVSGLVLLRLPARRSLARELSVAQRAALTPDGRHVATLAADGTLSLWRADTGALLRTARPDRERIQIESRVEHHSVVVSPDGGRVAAAGEGWITTIEVAAPHSVTGWEFTDEALTAGFVRDGEIVVEAGGVFTRWDPATGQQLGAPVRVPVRVPDALKWAPRPGRPQVAVTREDETAVELWDLDRGATVARWQPWPDSRTAGDIVFDRTGERLAVGGEDDPAVVLDTSDGREVARLPRYDDEQRETVPTEAQPVTFTRDGRLLLRGYQFAHVWRLPGSRIPFLDGGETTSLPVPGPWRKGGQVGTDREAEVLLHGSPEYVSTGSVGDDEGGWWLLPTDPARWRHDLCGRYPGGRIYGDSQFADDIRRLGDRLCGDG